MRGVNVVAAADCETMRQPSDTLLRASMLFTFWMDATQPVNVGVVGGVEGREGLVSAHRRNP
jgi:hypothetical protein